MRAAEEWVEDNFIGVLTTVMTVTILQVVGLYSCLTRHAVSFLNICDGFCLCACFVCHSLYFYFMICQCLCVIVIDRRCRQTN